MTADPAFTILAPINRPPDLMAFAVRSVLAQTRQDFELFIICDGAPAATVEAARVFEAEDPRIRSFVHPKGERHGEAYRHQALQEARGRIVCQIGDDDLWFPNHLAEAETLLAHADLGCTLPLFIEPDGGPRLRFVDLGDPAVQRQMAEGRGNAFGPTSSAYRLKTYRALPLGWSPAPEGAWTDLFMWRKFLALPGIRCATRFVATGVTFPQALRKDWTLRRRWEEIASVASRIESAAFREELFLEALADTARRSFATQSQLNNWKHAARALLSAVDEVEGVLCGIAETGDATAQAHLAQVTLGRLPHALWRDRLRDPANARAGHGPTRTGAMGGQASPETQRPDGAIAPPGLR